jgi:peptide chain release factor 3
MSLRVVRTGKDIRTSNAVSFLSQRRDLLEDAYPGDIIGIPNHGTLQLGDTLTEGETLQFTGLPFFAPELFQAVEVADPLKIKKLRTGLVQLGEEGAIQVFRPLDGGAMLLGAVGQLQFEVVLHRLKHEYGVDARLVPTKFRMARWVTSSKESLLKDFIKQNSYRVAEDAVNAPAFLASHGSELNIAMERWPDIQFHALREHSGLIFQAGLAA